MAEKSFNDRHARGLLLLDFCEGFSPAFAPVDTTLAPGSFATAVPTAISPSSLNSQLSSLKGKNTGLSNLAADTITNQKKRLKLYYDPNGFQEKFQSIKDAVKSQYGQTSPEFIAVKGLKW